LGWNYGKETKSNVKLGKNTVFIGRMPIFFMGNLENSFIDYQKKAGLFVFLTLNSVEHRLLC
jgi:hypothetical protein